MTDGVISCVCGRDPGMLTDVPAARQPLGRGRRGVDPLPGGWVPGRRSCWCTDTACPAATCFRSRGSSQADAPRTSPTCPAAAGTSGGRYATGVRDLADVHRADRSTQFAVAARPSSRTRSGVRSRSGKHAVRRAQLPSVRSCSSPRRSKPCQAPAAREQYFQALRDCTRDSAGLVPSLAVRECAPRGATGLHAMARSALAESRIEERASARPPAHAHRRAQRQRPLHPPVVGRRRSQTFCPPAPASSSFRTQVTSCRTRARRFVAEVVERVRGQERRARRRVRFRAAVGAVPLSPGKAVRRSLGDGATSRLTSRVWASARPSSQDHEERSEEEPDRRDDERPLCVATNVEDDPGCEEHKPQRERDERPSLRPVEHGRPILTARCQDHSDDSDNAICRSVSGSDATANQPTGTGFTGQAHLAARRQAGDQDSRPCMARRPDHNRRHRCVVRPGRLGVLRNVRSVRRPTKRLGKPERRVTVHTSLGGPTSLPSQSLTGRLSGPFREVRTVARAPLALPATQSVAARQRAQTSRGRPGDRFQ